MTNIVSAALARHFGRFPDAANAYHRDPLYYHQVTLVRRTLEMVDMAMEDADVAIPVRLRVIRAVLNSTPYEGDALDRIRQHNDTVQRLRSTLVEPPTVDPAMVSTPTADGGR